MELYQRAARIEDIARIKINASIFFENFPLQISLEDRLSDFVLNFED